jgi:hypothetical protein
MKNSIQHDAVAWFSQNGTGQAAFIPLAQSSEFSLELPRVIHKGLGQKGPLANYRYKSPNVSFSMEILASENWTLGGPFLFSNNLGTEEYDIENISLIGKSSALSPDISPIPNHLISVYQEGFTSGDISNLSGYSGFYCKFEDCKLSSLTLSAAVGNLLRASLEFIAQDASLTKGGFDYSSGYNHQYSVVRPQDIKVYLSSDDTNEYFEANINAFDLSLPIQYKIIEGFGSNKPINRKPVLPAAGTISLKGIPSKFTPMVDKWMEAEDSSLSCKIVMRAASIGGNLSEDDYMVISIPVMKLDSKSIGAGVGARASSDFTFSFFEYGNIGDSEKPEGLFFLRKVPDSVYSFYA